MLDEGRHFFGKSAVLDLTSPAAVEWLKGELDVLVREYGVDGFKFDASDVHFYTGEGMRLPAGTVGFFCASHGAAFCEGEVLY